MTRPIVLGIALIIAVPQVRAEPDRVAGVIAQVDREHFRLHVVATSGEESWVVCDTNVVVTIRGYAATFKDLEPSYRVILSLDTETGRALRVDAFP